MNGDRGSRTMFAILLFKPFSHYGLSGILEGEEEYDGGEQEEKKKKREAVICCGGLLSLRNWEERAHGK